MRPIFSAWLAPFKEMGAETLTSTGIYATDHNSFDEVGLPGFQFIRDFMENNPRTAHTNMDVFEHVLQDDLKQSAVIAASFVYQAAMRDKQLPRKRNPTDGALASTPAIADATRRSSAVAVSHKGKLAAGAEIALDKQNSYVHVREFVWNVQSGKLLWTLGITSSMSTLWYSR